MTTATEAPTRRLPVLRVVEAPPKPGRTTPAYTDRRSYARVAGKPTTLPKGYVQPGGE